MNEATPADPFVRATRLVAVTCLLGLIALGLAWELWLAPTGRGTLALKVLPLVLPLVGLLKYRLFTYRWVSLFIWLYFIEGIVRATSGHDASVPLAWIEVVLCSVLFITCAAHVRWRLKRARDPQAERRAAPKPTHIPVGDRPAYSADEGLK